MVWIHQRQKWPNFIWDSSVLTSKLADIRHWQGRL
ncbi:MAG: DUF4172 domain-containing protein [Leptolyngbya sp. SIO4C1]|nr:DUF4172 domain-containing protein [Leptolyngbya sp. SIO4C1]